MLKRTSTQLAYLLLLASGATAIPAGGSIIAEEAPGTPALMSGDELWKACSAPDAYNHYCGGYIAGAADSLTAEIPNPAACLPREVSAETLVSVVKTYLGQHAEKRHFGAFEVIRLALAPTFPCIP